MKTVITAMIGLLLVPHLAIAQAPEDQAMPDNAAIARILADRIDRDQQGVGIAVGLIEAGIPRFVVHGDQANTSTDIGVDDIGMHLINADLPLAVRPKHHVAVDIDPALLANYVGDYALNPQFTFSVTTENGHGQYLPGARQP